MKGISGGVTTKKKSASKVNWKTRAFLFGVAFWPVSRTVRAFWAGSF